MEEEREKEHAKFLDDLDRGSWAARLFGEKMNAEERKQVEQGVSDFFGTLSQLRSSKNKTEWEIGKQAAATEAGIKTAQGAISAYTSLAGIPYVGPVLGAIAAAAVIAYGAEQIASIESQSFPQAAAGAYAPGDGSPVRIGEAGNPEWVLNQGGIKKIAQAAGGGGQQNIHLVMNRRTMQTWSVGNSQEQYRLRKEGRIP